MLWENILRGRLASKKKKIEERKGKQRELYIPYREENFTKCKNTIQLFREMISSHLIVFIKQSLWVANYKDKKGIYIKKNTKEKISCGVVRTEEISHQSRMGWCEIRTCLGWCEIRTYLMQLSSEGHIFLILAPNHTQFEALDS